jgi:hypothetical protein
MKRANPLKPWAFAYLYDSLVAVAQDHGYALALHGSMSRDLDLIAVPWTNNASTKPVLMDALNKDISRFRVDKFRKGYEENDLKTPTKKPHGRTAYALHLGGDAYVDISIMPRRVPRKR